MLIGGGAAGQMLYAARALRLMGVHTTAVLGFRDSEGVFLEEEFLKTACLERNECESVGVRR